MMLASRRRFSVFFHTAPLEKKKTGALDQAVQKIDFCEVHFGNSVGEGSGTLKLCQSIYLKPLPVPFHQHSLLYTFKVTHVSVKLNRMQCKQSDFKTQSYAMQTK